MKKKKKEYKQLSVSAEQAPEKTLSTHFKRPRWKHFVRMGTFGMLLMLYALFLFTSYNSHVVLHESFHPKELIAYMVALVIAVPIFPQVFMEADEVTIEESGIVIKNLLFAKRLAWQDIKSFSNPIYLKFAIIRSPKFYYLLNRRDLPNFDQLVEQIQQKTAQLDK